MSDYNFTIPRRKFINPRKELKIHKKGIEMKKL